MNIYLLEANELEQTITWIDKMKDKIVEFCMSSGLKIVEGLLIILIGFKLVNILGNKIKKSKFYDRLDPTARSFFRSFTTVSLKIILVIIAAALLGVPMTSMVALIGSAGLAVGLALQGSLSNIAGGFIILVFKPFVVGDFISSGDVNGTVKSISIFYTKIITVDNKVMMVPNSVISNQSLTDVTAMPTRRVDLTFCASYSCDVEEVKNILMSVASSHEKVLKDPAPVARLSEHDSSSLNFILRVWCATDDYWDVHFDLTENVKKAFDESKIEIPYPQLDVHLDK